MSRYPQTILGTCCIPWNEDYSLDEELFRDQVRFLIEHGIRNLYIFGTAGEGHAVSDSQFATIAGVFAEEMKACHATPMVGVISLSLSTIIERIENATALGVSDFQISLPSWGALSDSELQTFFRETCGRFPQCRFLHYNLLRAKRLVTPAEYAKLAAEYPNLVATKHGTSDSNLVAGLLREAPQVRHFFTEPSFSYASLLGECGLLVSVASCNLQRVQQYFQAGCARETQSLMEMQRELGAIVAALLCIVGAHAHMDGAFDKIFCKLHQPNFPLRLLPPYQSATEESFQEFAKFLKTNFPQWLPQADSITNHSSQRRKEL